MTVAPPDLSSASVARLIRLACQKLGCSQNKLAATLPMDPANLSRARTKNAIAPTTRARLIALIQGEASEPLNRRGGRPPCADSYNVSIMLSDAEARMVRSHVKQTKRSLPSIVARAIAAYTIAAKPLPLPAATKRLRARVDPKTMDAFPAAHRLEHLRQAVLEEIAR